MTRTEEMISEKKLNESFKSQRELPNGRDYRWNSFIHITPEQRKNFRKNMDTIFPNAPGAGI
jgi:hypothetical protein